jgi:ABC-2 type transport system permease protein
MRGLFPNALHVAKREYMFRVRNRAFRVTTILLAIAVVLITQAPTILAMVGAGDPPEIVVAVEAEDLASDPVTSIQQVLTIAADPDAEDGRDPEEQARVTRTDDPEAAAQQVRDGELDALLTITRDADGELEFEYLSEAGPTNQTRLLVTQAATGMAVAERLEQAGVDPQETASIFQPPSFTAVPIDPDDVRSEDDFGGSFILAYALVILTLMAVITYGTWVAQSVAEEKSNRVMELLITAALPSSASSPTSRSPRRSAPRARRPSSCPPWSRG